MDINDYIYINDYTRLINVNTLKYPVYFPEARRLNPNVSFPALCREDYLAPYGYVPVLDSIPPEGDVVTEITPVLAEDGRFYRTYEVRDYNEEEFWEFKKNRVESASFFYYNDLSTGLYFTHNSELLQASFTSSDMNYLNIVKEFPERYSTISIKLIDGVLLDIPYAEGMALYSDILDAFDAISELYFHYLAELYAARNTSECPEELFTFKITTT